MTFAEFVEQLAEAMENDDFKSIRKLQQWVSSVMSNDKDSYEHLINVCEAVLSDYCDLKADFENCGPWTAKI